MSPIDKLKSVLCGPDVKCCIAGSDEDRAIIDRALRALEQPAVKPVTDEENEQFSYDVGRFSGSDPEATMYALEQFLKRRTAPPNHSSQPVPPLTDEEISE